MKRISLTLAAILLILGISRNAHAQVASTTNNGTADMTTIQREVDSLRTQLNNIPTTLSGFWLSLQNLLNNQSLYSTTTSTSTNATSTSTNASTTPATSGSGYLDQGNSMTALGGSTVDWSGRNFAPETSVTVTQNGNYVTTAHADGGGNWSTGNITLPSSPGTYIYNFSDGMGNSKNSTVTVQ